MQSRVVVSETLIDCSNEKIGIRQVRSLVVAGRSFLLVVVRRKRRSSIILKGKKPRDSSGIRRRRDLFTELIDRSAGERCDGAGPLFRLLLRFQLFF